MHLISIRSHDVFQALADPIRIRIMRLFLASGEESCLCEIADSLVEPEYKLSRHMKILRQAGLLTSFKEGRWVYHRLVSGVPFLQSIYGALREASDEDRQFAKDLALFKKRMRFRDSGRCKTDSQQSRIVHPRTQKSTRTAYVKS